VTRTTHFLALRMAALACAVFLGGAAAAEGYLIQLARPLQKGAKYRISAKGSRTDASVMSRDEQVIREAENTIRVELEGQIEILEVDEAGRPLKEALGVELFVYGLGGQLTNSVATGQVIIAETVGTRTEFRLAGERLSGLASAALEIVLSTYRGDVPDEDYMFGTFGRRVVGDTWPVNGEAVASLMASSGTRVDTENLDGSVTLAGIENVSGVECLRIDARVEIDDFSMTDLPSGVELEEGKAEVTVSGLFPTDPALAKLQDKTSVRMEMVLTSTDGPFAGATMRTRSIQSGEKTLVPFTD